MINRLLLIFFCSVVIWHQTQAQSDCETTLNTATDEFNAGHFYGIAGLLKPCIDNGFTKEQRQRAYLLLAQVYLLLDDPIGAENSYLSLLRANPEFETDPSRDPIDVVYLSKKFTATPIFSIYGKLGGNVSFVNVIQEVNLTDGPIENDYIIKPGWVAGLGLDWNKNEKLSVSLEVQYAYTAYRREQTGFFNRNSSTDLLDRQNWVLFPVTIKYIHNLGNKIFPYGYAGLSVNLLIDDKANATFTTQAPTLNITESPIIKPKRNFINTSLLLGGGARYKYGLNYLFVDLRYSIGLTNLFDYKGGYEDYSNESDVRDPVFRFVSIDNFFKLNNLYLTVGFIQPLYKPRKLKKARTKSVLRNLDND